MLCRAATLSVVSSWHLGATTSVSITRSPSMDSLDGSKSPPALRVEMPPPPPPPLSSVKGDRRAAPGPAYAACSFWIVLFPWRIYSIQSQNLSCRTVNVLRLSWCCTGLVLWRYCAPVLAAANMPDDVVLRSCRASARSTDGLQRGEGSFDGKEVGSPSEMVTPYPSPIAVARGSLLTVLGTCALRRERSSGWLRATASWHRATASRTRS